MPGQSANRLLDWLDQRNGWQFVAVLYVARWLVLAPVIAFNLLAFADPEQTAPSLPEELSKVNPAVLFLILVVVSPLFETLVECTLPYFIISRVRNYRESRPKRCWGFVAISACVMALLHPMLAALVPSLITGGFLAYCYARFAASSAGQAIFATTVFHGAINVVGWTMILIS